MQLKNLLTTASILGLSLLPVSVQADLINPGTDRPRDVPAQTNFRTTVINIINYVLTFVGIIAVVILIYAGFLYLTAAGDEGATKKAKSMIFTSLIGIIIILLSFVIVNTVITQGTTAINGGQPTG